MEIVHEPQERYDGPARVADHEVDVVLRGHFEPIDGKFHWWGRIAPDPQLTERASGSTVEIATPHGSAVGRLSDVDPWGRFRIAGTGSPPF